jgi:ankyrin repeat protein
MKYIKLFEKFENYDPMIISPNKKSEMIRDEMEKPIPNLNLVEDLIKSDINLNWQDEGHYKWTILHYTVFYNRIEIAKIMIDAGADVNIKNEDGDSPLHFSAYYDRYEISKMLIDAGADLDMQEDSGKTALHLSVYNNNIKNVKNLMNAGAKTDIKDNYGQTPYDLAKSEEMKEFLQL